MDEDQALTQCAHLGLGLTVSEDGQVIVIITMGETESTHSVTMPTPQASSFCVALISILQEAQSLEENFANLPEEALRAAVEELHRRFSAKLN